jgi:DNA gyrase/topoisomerase IV subunit B
MDTRASDTKVKRLADSSKERSSVTVTFVPDFEYFGEAGETFSEDTVALFRSRFMDAAGCTPRPSISFDGNTIKIKRFADYVRLYVPSGAFVEHVAGPWRLAVCRSSEGSGYSHVSSVIGVSTALGGTHVDAACTALMRALAQVLKGSERCVPALRAALFLMVHVDVANPKLLEPVQGRVQHARLPAAQAGPAARAGQEVVAAVLLGLTRSFSNPFELRPRHLTKIDQH